MKIIKSNHSLRNYNYKNKKLKKNAGTKNYLFKILMKSQTGKI